MADTQFSAVYNRFLGQITDDLYLELTPEDTLKDMQNLLLNAIPGFEFPRKNLYDYTIEVREMDEVDLVPEDLESIRLNENGEFELKLNTASFEPGMYVVEFMGKAITSGRKLWQIKKK